MVVAVRILAGDEEFQKFQIGKGRRRAVGVEDELINPRRVYIPRKVNDPHFVKAEIDHHILPVVLGEVDIRVRERRAVAGARDKLDPVHIAGACVLKDVTTVAALAVSADRKAIKIFLRAAGRVRDAPAAAQIVVACAAFDGFVAATDGRAVGVRAAVKAEDGIVTSRRHAVNDSLTDIVCGHRCGSGVCYQRQILNACAANLVKSDDADRLHLRPAGRARVEDVDDDVGSVAKLTTLEGNLAGRAEIDRHVRLSDALLDYVVTDLANREERLIILNDARRRVHTVRTAEESFISGRGREDREVIAVLIRDVRHDDCVVRDQSVELRPVQGIAVSKEIDRLELIRVRQEQAVAITEIDPDIVRTIVVLDQRDGRPDIGGTEPDEIDNVRTAGAVFAVSVIAVTGREAVGVVARAAAHKDVRPDRFAENVGLARSVDVRIAVRQSLVNRTLHRFGAGHRRAGGIHDRFDRKGECVDISFDEDDFVRRVHGCDRTNSQIRHRINIMHEIRHHIEFKLGERVVVDEQRVVALRIRLNDPQSLVARVEVIDVVTAAKRDDVVSGTPCVGIDEIRPGRADDVVVAGRHLSLERIEIDVRETDRRWRVVATEHQIFDHSRTLECVELLDDDFALVRPVVQGDLQVKTARQLRELNFAGRVDEAVRVKDQVEAVNLKKVLIIRAAVEDRINAVTGVIDIGVGPVPAVEEIVPGAAAKRILAEIEPEDPIIA